MPQSRRHHPWTTASAAPTKARLRFLSVTNVASRVPGGRGFAPREAKVLFKPCLLSGTGGLLSPWGPSCAAVGSTLQLWCRASASAIRTDIRSCRSHERSRRSLRRLAPPARSATTDQSQVFCTSGYAHVETRTCLKNCWWCWWCSVVLVQGPLKGKSSANCWRSRVRVTQNETSCTEL